jgi:FkbH-like protein
MGSKMKLVEALEILQKGQSEHAQSFRAYLACGFEPLHLQTFIAAQLRQAFRDRKTEVLSGIYGDFWGNLDRLPAAGADVGIVISEWSDLDPRLGLRSLGSWESVTFAEILENVRTGASHLVEVAQNLSRQTALVISLPTLPLPPISFTPGWHAGALDLELRAIVSSVGVQIARTANVKLLNPERLDRLSPPSARLDAKSELASGFPYKLTHASTVAEMVSRLVSSPAPKKGLITDLDDTLWNGILGEEGFDGIFWDLEHHSQSHGLYQRLLRSLSETGVLVAAASKNDPQLVDKALDRSDLILERKAIFPVEAHWGPKSESVSRILETWNIGADSVVFIDDSPMELAEVKAAHPGVECILFPKDDSQGLMDLLQQLRDLFGKAVLSEEDTIRRESIRRFHESTKEFGGSDKKFQDFLEQAEAEVALNFSKEPPDPRALELVNKTNQFNLNGRRYTESAWQSYLKQPDTFLLIAAYKDKYGPLGKIAVLAGQRRSKKIFLDVWVMSCRAFSRRIEHRCIEELFKHFGVNDIAFAFQATPKNGPLREFLTHLLGQEPKPGCQLSRDRFTAVQEKTSPRVLEVSNG